MSQPTTYLQHHIALINELISVAEKLLAMNTLREPQQEALYEQLQQLAKADADEDFYVLGQSILVKIVAAWPQLTPNISRDLFWFFGGDCLQYMPDEEIANYQALDEARHVADSADQPFDIATEKAKIFGLH
ncbi:PA2817 family protein [Simiduia aestuariiviva]|uniref:Dehydrogenase n=1 Tax=Simiduia aestuariiviva TaxID=1510459 RepID=A0A839UKS7_9GAMM|nr:PA2817 family protein [Simiduia aestuariiviva]MBB3168734.1 hypothetical protein [Simiduia aestuariiviva]